MTRRLSSVELSWLRSVQQQYWLRRQIEENLAAHRLQIAAERLQMAMREAYLSGQLVPTIQEKPI